MKLEKLFFLITRWLMLIGAAVAFVFLIGGGIYAIKLYNTSNDTEVEENIYQSKAPKVSFDNYKNIFEQKLKAKKEQREKIEKYILDIISKGSKGHGYPISNMPSGLLKNKRAKKVAFYVSSELSGNRPIDFKACASCHGEDGKGMNGQAPSLLELPIYNGLVSSKSSNKTYPASNSNNNYKYSNPLKSYSANITSIINRYAINTNQEGITVDDTFSLIKDLKKQYNVETFSLLKQQLKQELTSLLNYSKTYKTENNSTNLTIIKWKDFITWFLKDFNNQLKIENQKYKHSLQILENKKYSKQSEASRAKIELLQLLMALGTALIVFILLTMILVLFKIEANTRKNIED